MQKKHLHPLLTVSLLLGLYGCGDSHIAPENPYISGKRQLNLSISSGESQRLAWGSLTAELFSPSTDTPLLLRASVEGRGQIQLSLEGSSRGMGDSLHFNRSLAGLSLNSSTGKQQINLLPLPDGHGFVLSCDGWGGPSTILSVDFWEVTAIPALDDPLLPNWADAAKGLLVWPDDHLGNIAIGIEPRNDLFTATAQADKRLKFALPQNAPQRIVIAFGERYSASVERVRRYLEGERTEIARAVLDTLKASAAFSLVTEDDRVNKAAALLLSRLVHANRHPVLFNEQSLEHEAELAVGSFLASRDLPGTVIPGGNPWIDAQIAHFNTDSRLFWSAQACRAVMAYGMHTGDRLTQFQSDLLGVISRYDDAYQQDFAAIADPGIADSLMRRAISHLRFSNFLELGEQISKNRGQSSAQSAFRERYLNAARSAQRAFDASARSYTYFLKNQAAAKRDGKSDEEIDPLDLLSELNRAAPSYPDTAAMVIAGARFGFYGMDRKPEAYLASRSRWNPEVWQSWVSYRFHADIQLAETSDYDSLIAVLLDGPVPGSLTEFRDGREEPSLAGTSAALANLSEIYLGIRPNWIMNTIEIAPRPPVSWGRTTARVPLGTGWLRVEYDFVKEIAFVGIEEIKEDLKILFRYPLPSSLALTAQFILSPDKPTVKIHVERDSGNRMVLEVDKASW